MISTLMNDVNFPIKIKSFYFPMPLQNWSYVLYWDHFAVVIDPFEAIAIGDFITQSSLKLLAILNTHDHFDHIGGNADLLKRFPSAFLLTSPNDIPWPKNMSMDAIFTPGHCAKHHCFALYHGPKMTALFSGDLLFHGGVGRIMQDGSLEKLFESLELILMRTPGSAVIYPGHDYMDKNLSFAKTFPFFYSEELELHQQDFTMQREIERNIFLWSMYPKNWEKIPLEWRKNTPLETIRNFRLLRNRS